MIKSPTSCATSCCKQLFVSKLCLLSSSILLKKLPSTWANHSAESPDQYGGSLTLNAITSWPGTAWYPSGVVGVRGIRLSWQWFLSHCVPQREICLSFPDSHSKVYHQFPSCPNNLSCWGTKKWLKDVVRPLCSTCAPYVWCMQDCWIWHQLTWDILLLLPDYMYIHL